MGTKYTTETESGYNASPPSDDGTAVSSNEVKWSFIKTKLADVVLTLAQNINTKLLTHFDESVVDKSTAFTTTTAEHKRTINVTASATISLGDAGTVGAGYIVTVKNSHSAANTVDLVTGADTLDGTAAGSISLAPDAAMTFVTNAGADGYFKASMNIGDDLTIANDLTVTNDLTVSNDASVTGDLTVTGSGPHVATQATNHIRAGSTQLYDSDGTKAKFDADGDITESTFETIGPTGSGATNIWTAMDDMPASAQAVIINLQMSGTTTGVGSMVLSTYAQSGDTSIAVGIETEIFSQTFDFNSASATGGTSGQVIIPVNSSQVFKFTWSATGESGPQFNLSYRGFITD